MLLAESEGMLQRIVDEFDRVCKMRKLKVNTGKGKVMVFERAREEEGRGKVGQSGRQDEGKEEKRYRKTGRKVERTKEKEKNGE